MTAVTLRWEGCARLEDLYTIPLQDMNGLFHGSFAAFLDLAESWHHYPPVQMDAFAWMMMDSWQDLNELCDVIVHLLPEFLLVTTQHQNGSKNYLEMLVDAKGGVTRTICVYGNERTWTPTGSFDAKDRADFHILLGDMYTNAERVWRA